MENIKYNNLILLSIENTIASYKIEKIEVENKPDDYIDEIGDTKKDILNLLNRQIKEYQELKDEFINDILDLLNRQIKEYKELK